MKDFLLDTDHDLMQKNGDLVFDEADAQNIESLVLLNQGELKYSPLTGCNIIKLVNGRLNAQEVKRDVKLQLQADGWKNENIQFDGQNLNVVANR